MAPSDPDRYALGDEIARGGMGAIVRAHDRTLNREVAVKILLDKYAPDGGAARRFADEAKITAQLQHPGIPPVYDLGALPDGRPFLAMKLIKGDTLDDRLKQRSDPGADRGELVAAFEAVCQAVAYAHTHGVLHRDLKPANVMVGAFGEVQVMDWGLAKVLGTARADPTDDPEATTPTTAVASERESEDLLTRAGSVLGTPAYMPPEQAIGAIDQIDRRSDVFGLGGILAAILTGRPPFAADTAESTRQLAAKGQVTDCFARLDGSGADPELVALCKRCLAPEKEYRPEDAGAVAGAVEEFRRAAEERARKADLDRVKAEGDRARAEATAAEQRKRRRVQSALGMAFTALLALGGVFIWWQDRQASDRRAEQASVEARAQQAVDSATAQAVGLRDRYRFADATAVLDRAAALVPPGAPALAERVATARKELALVRRLDEIRISRIRSNFVAGEGEVVREYPAAFRELGLDPTSPDSAAVGDLVAASPIKRHLIVALDDWSQWDRTAAVQKRLLAVIRRADPGPWSDRLRDEASRYDRAALDRLVAEADPADVPPNLIVLLFQLRGYGWAEAARWLAVAVHRHPEDFWLLFEAGFYFYDKDPHPAKAAELLRAARTLRPDVPLVNQFLCDCLVRTGRLPETVALTQGVLRDDPIAAWAHKALGRALARTDPDRAIDSYRRAAELDPKDTRSREVLCIMLRERGDLNGALAAAHEFVRVAPVNGIARAQLGWTHRVRREYDEAAACYAEVVRLLPADAGLRSEYGTILREKGDLDRAIVAYQEAIRLDPRSPTSHFYLGLTFENQVELDRAESAYLDAIRLSPQFVPAHYNLGEVYRKRGHHAAAVAAYRVALAITPDHGPASDALDYCLRARHGEVPIAPPPRAVGR